MKCRLVVVPWLITAMGSAYAQGIITTVAGADWVFTGNGKPALNAPLGNVSGITVDPSDGNPVVVDPQSCIVAKIKAGILSVIAGNGFCSISSGDGGPATGASLHMPLSVVYDRLDNLYIGGLYDVRKVTSNGTISTLTTSVTDVQGIAVDNLGNVYVAEQSQNCVNRIAPDSTVSLFAGSCTTYIPPGADLNYTLLAPGSVALDAAGNVYVAQTGSVVELYAMPPNGMPASLLHPMAGPATSVAFDNAGAMYLGGVSGVAKVVKGVTTFLAGPANFGTRIYIAPDNAGNVYVADYANSQVKKVSSSGVVTAVAGNGKYSYYGGENIPAVSAFLQSPAALTFGTDQSLIFSDSAANRVFRIDSQSAALTTLASPPDPIGVTVDPGGTLHIGVALPLPAAAGTIAYTNANRLTSDKSGSLYYSNRGPFTRTYLSEVLGPNGFHAGGLAQIDCISYGPCGSFAADSYFASAAGLTIDPHGNLLVADTGTNAIFRVAAPFSGESALSVIAGNTKAASTGDGGPATQASLNGPQGVAYDSQGNLYIADTGNNRIRKVDPFGIITTFAGGGPPDVRGDGLPSTQASLDTPVDVAVDPAGDVYIADAGAERRIRVVLSTSPTMTVTPNTLNLTAASGGAPVIRNLLVTGSTAAMASFAGLQFSVTIPVCSTSPCWLTADTTSDQTPRSVAITADPGTLQPGSYTAAIAIIPVAATPALIVVNVTFTVTAPQPPKLGVDPTAVTFTLPACTTLTGAGCVTAGARTSMLAISNLGGGSINYTATPSTSNGGNWLTVSTTSGLATPGQPSTLSVTANPCPGGTCLPPNVYSGQLTISTTQAGSLVVPVVMSLSSNPQAVLLSQTGMSFTAVSGGGVIPPQSFGVINAGSGMMNWTASATTTGGGNWLTVCANSCGLVPPAGGWPPTTAQSGPAGTPAPQVTVGIDTTQLPSAGSYYGTVTVIAPGTANGSRSVAVFLKVLPANTPAPSAVQPTELIFYTTTTAASPPGSQPVDLYNVTGAAQNFVSQRSAGAASSFPLYTLPGTGILDPQQPTQVVVQPGGTFKTAGTYTEALTFQFSDGTVQTVKVTVVSTVPPPPSTPNDRPKDASVCVPKTLVVTAPTLTASFQVYAAWPFAITTNIQDNCNNPLTAGTVTMQFNGDGSPPLNMTSLSNGVWHGTWTPTNPNAAVTLTVTATGGTGLTGSETIGGNTSNQNATPQISTGSMTLASPPAVFLPAAIGAMGAPAVCSNSTTGAAAGLPLTVIAPGSVLAIASPTLTPLATSAVMAPAGTTLPTILPGGSTGTSVYINGVAAPIYSVSPNLLCVAVPYEVPLNSSTQIQVHVGSARSEYVPVSVAAAQPAVLAVVDTTQAGALVMPGTPVAPGDTLAIYCLGLGATTPSLADGAVTPMGQAYSVSGVSVTIGAGGQPATVPAQLVAGTVGLYQIMVTIPAGVSPGTLPLSITAADQTTTVSLNVNSVLAPAITVNGLVNAASFASGGIVPGEIATIFGANLTTGTGINLSPALPLATQLLNVQVLVNGTAAPLFAVDNANGQQQINFQVPYEVAAQGSTATVQVMDNGLPGNTITVPVIAAQPGIFTYTVGSITYGAILHANFQLANTGSPAVAGETVQIFCTGLGAVSPTPADGAAAGAVPPRLRRRSRLAASPRQLPTPVWRRVFGLYQVNAQVPSGCRPAISPSSLRSMGPTAPSPCCR